MPGYGTRLSFAAVLVAALPAIAQTPSGINAPNNQGIITQGQTGGTNIVQQGPPRLPLGLYQSGFEIGLVQRFAVSSDGKQIVLTNPRIASGTVDFSANMEIQDYVIYCPGLAPPTRGQAAFTSSVVIGDVSCAIIGSR